MALLIDLPVELLSRIASHLFQSDAGSHGRFEDDGLCSLRLSCRCIEIRTRYLFERAAYSTLAVTLQARSLRKLRDISSHPRFGKLIKKLVFFKAHHPVYDEDVAPLGPGGRYRKHEYAGYGVIELPKDGSDDIYPNEGLTLRKRVQLGLQDIFAAITSLTPSLKDVVIEPNFMASFWLDSPSRQEQLDERARCINRAACASDRESEHFQAGGLSSDDIGEISDDEDVVDPENEDYDNDDSDDPSYLETYVSPDYLLYFLTKAAQHQGLLFSSLSSINPNASSIRARTFVELTLALQNVQHLSISINTSNATRLQRMNGSALHRHINGEPVARTFGQALNSLHNLRTLHLTFDNHYWEYDRNWNISASLNHLSDTVFEHLTTVDIRLASFKTNDLQDFLRKQSSTLQQLTLCRIILTSTEHWRPILVLMLEDMPLLIKACCSGLISEERFNEITDPLVLTGGWKGCCEIACVEREAVLAGLRQALLGFSDAVL